MPVLAPTIPSSPAQPLPGRTALFPAQVLKDSASSVHGAPTCLRRWKGKGVESCQSCTDTNSTCHVLWPWDFAFGLALKWLLSRSGLLSGLAAHSTGGELKRAAVPLLRWGQWVVIIYVVLLPNMFWVHSKGREKHGPCPGEPCIIERAVSALSRLWALRTSHPSHWEDCLRLKGVLGIMQTTPTTVMDWDLFILPRAMAGSLEEIPQCPLIVCSNCCNSSWNDEVFS